MIKKDHYDVVVVGAGPAGSTAARYAAKMGASVLLLEKDREIGVPVRCAEGVGAEGIHRILGKLEDRWIAAKIEGFRVHAPDESVVEVRWPNCGYILDRKIFDYELANMAGAEGAEVVTKAYVHGLQKEESGRIVGVKIRHMGEDIEIKCDITIGADGVESRVGRWAGQNTFTKMNDMESCAQVTIADIDTDQKFCDFFFSNIRVPGGYIWIFPKGNRTANVGLGISGEYSSKKSALAFLREFIESRFAGKPVLSTLCGGVPCAKTRNEISGEGYMLVGDAAHQVNPISGGGIVPGMYAGMLAGSTASEAVREKNFTAKRLEEYDRTWNRGVGKDHERFYKLKDALYGLTDAELNRLSQDLQHVPVEDRNAMRLFRTALKSRPKLLLDVIKLFTP